MDDAAVVDLSFNDHFLDFDFQLSNSKANQNHKNSQHLLRQHKETEEQEDYQSAVGFVVDGGGVVGHKEEKDSKNGGGSDMLVG